jgi:predicted SnoaL-like aldol condensation-catalyzing enzyme
VEFRSMDIYRIADGQIVEHYGRIDELGLLEQLGVKHDLAWPG